MEWPNRHCSIINNVKTCTQTPEVMRSKSKWKQWEREHIYVEHFYSSMTSTFIHKAMEAGRLLCCSRTLSQCWPLNMMITMVKQKYAESAEEKVSLLDLKWILLDPSGAKGIIYVRCRGWQAEVRNTYCIYSKRVVTGVYAKFTKTGPRNFWPQCMGVYRYAGSLPQSKNVP